MLISSEQKKMTPTQLTDYIAQCYATVPDFPWAKHPDYAVFRYQNNRKWFALLMFIPAHFLAIPKKEHKIHVVNVKVLPEWIGQLRMLSGIYPAYHMDKSHRLSLVLSELDEKTVKQLVDERFRLTS